MDARLKSQKELNLYYLFSESLTRMPWAACDYLMVVDGNMYGHTEDFGKCITKEFWKEDSPYYHEHKAKRKFIEDAWGIVNKLEKELINTLYNLALHPLKRSKTNKDSDEVIIKRCMDMDSDQRYGGHRKICYSLDGIIK